MNSTRLLILVVVATFVLPVKADDLVLASFAASTSAPHGQGNLYAPEIVKHCGEFLMFFGGQGSDEHDRIHLATSKNGRKWQQQGVVFAPKNVNHVNDPSVVVVGDRLFMFHTLAGSGVTDSIGLATSTDSRAWKNRGSVFAPAKAPAWDSLLVGRPSVLFDGKRFHMWYDGRKDLPLEAPDKTAPKSSKSRRYVGYAVSNDGVKWSRRAEPVFGNDAGGIDVIRHRDTFYMVIESRDGTKWASSRDGITWKARGILHPKGSRSEHGHVTPFLLKQDDTWQLFYGAAASRTWDQNSIYSARIVMSSIVPLTRESPSGKPRLQKDH